MSAVCEQTKFLFKAKEPLRVNLAQAFDRDARMRDLIKRLKHRPESTNTDHRPKAVTPG